MKRISVLLVLVVTLFAPRQTVLGQAPMDPELEADIRKLIEASGSGNLALQMINQIMGPMRQAMPEVPSDFWTQFMEKVNPDELMDMVVPIYAKYFTHEEIRQLMAFYQSPLGEKVAVTATSAANPSSLLRDLPSSETRCT